MTIRNVCSTFTTIPIILLLMTGCVETPETDIYTKDPDPQYIMDVTFTYEDGTSHDREVPVNQIMVMFDEEVTPSEASSILSTMTKNHRSVRLALVGQIPDLGVYQLEIINKNTDPQMAIDTLNQVIEDLRGYERVDSVTYNELMKPYFAENDDDNTDFFFDDRCPFATLDYYQAIPIFDEVLPHLTLSPVTVAVIDSGIDLSTGQFDDIQSPESRFQYRDLGAPLAAPTDSDPVIHGTCVASLIAADNGDGLINGIALRVLQDNLSLIVVNTRSADAARVIASTRWAVQRGAKIINMSFGNHANGNRPQWLRNLQRMWMRLFTRDDSQDVLFVAAASNDGFELDNNDSPAGLSATNLITVGGLDSCDYELPYTRSSTGPGIDIAAPATGIPVGDPSPVPNRQIRNGNSYATPIVASMAAIILSIDPYLSGAELKEFLIDDDHVWPAAEEVSGKRVALIKTVGNAILNSALPSQAVDDIMDAYGGFTDNIPDPSGHMINRLYGEIEFSVSGPGYSQNHTLNATDLAFTTAQTNFGIIGNHQTVFNLHQGRDSITPFTTSGFRIDQEYPIYPSGPNGYAMSAGAPGGDYSGAGISGSILYTECELTTRSLLLTWFSPANSGPDQLIFIEVSGVLTPSMANGFIETTEGIQEDVIYNTSGEFTMAFTLVDPDSATLDHLEEVCEGGYNFMDFTN